MKIIILKISINLEKIYSIYLISLYQAILYKDHFFNIKAKMNIN